jgi:type I restriction enzyme S subunit
MHDGWRQLVLGDVARLSIEREQVDANRAYPTAGVLNAGQGLFDRGLVPGSSTNYPALHRLRGGKLVMRKLTAWEGPVAVVPEQFDGFYVSTEFPTFDLDTTQISPSFMQLICQQPLF